MQHVSTEKLITLGLLLLFWGLALTSLIGDSPTMDEQNHLTRGYAFISTGDPRLSIEHPPLVNSWAALPLLTENNLALPLDQSGWQGREWYSVADRFFWQDGNPVLKLVFMGRVMIVFLTIGLAFVGRAFARQLWGAPAGLVAFAGLLFDPSIFAHGRYITTDLGGTLFIFLATFSIYNLFQATTKWPLKKLLIATLCIGLAFASKLTSMVFIFVWIALACVPFSPQPFGRRLVHLATAGVGSLVVLWAVFGFEYGPFLFIDESLLWLNAYSGPMPTFWSGIERITLISGGGRPAFLLSMHSTEGFWFYFPVAFLVKTPLFVLLGFIFAVPAMLWHKPSRPKTIWLMVPIVIYFSFSLTSALNIGYRHLLPILPFVYLILSGFIATYFPKWLAWASDVPDASKTLAGWIGQASIVLLIIPSVFYHPHQISFFNLSFGGPNNGSIVLVDSNIDWGQDLGRLKMWMDQNQVDHINLAWFGTADPAVYGLSHTPLPGEPRHRNLWWDVPFDRTNPAPGIYAISATNLREMPLVPEEKTVYAFFRNMEPIDQIGYSIFIYEVK